MPKYWLLNKEILVDVITHMKSIAMIFICVIAKCKMQNANSKSLQSHLQIESHYKMEIKRFPHSMLSKFIGSLRYLSYGLTKIVL